VDDAARLSEVQLRGNADMKFDWAFTAGMRRGVIIRTVIAMDMSRKR
jgi:hypothetical protein